MKCIGVMRINSSFLDTVFELLDTPNTMYQGSLTTEKRSDIQYDVEFRDVSFKYPGSEAYALRHVNMKFKVGSRLAVVGMNGSGKTTFIKLLCRLYDPTEGEILLNGINIRKYRYDDYMKIFSVVFQDFQLLALPLGQNVATSQTYDAARVLDCLNKAGFGEKLAKMPHGLDTYLYKSVDTEGVDVSGGEAQKSPLHEHCTRIRRSLSLTNRRPHLTRLPKRRFIQNSMKLQVIRLRFTSATASPPANSVMRSPCLTAAA